MKYSHAKPRDIRQPIVYGIVVASLLGADDLAAAPPSSTAPAMIETSPVARERLPEGVVVHGDKLARALTFHDKRGAHFLVLSSSEDHGASRGGQIFVDDWVIDARGKPHSRLPVRDMVDECEMGGLSVRFHDDATAVTDLDHDGLAEVTFAYEVACRSDVSPATYKLLVLEDGTKYILRGTTRVDPSGDGSVAGGSFTPDPAAARWPAAFLEHAKRRWAATNDDLESPPHKRP